MKSSNQHRYRLSFKVVLFVMALNILMATFRWTGKIPFWHYEFKISVLESFGNYDSIIAYDTDNDGIDEIIATTKSLP